MKESEEVHALRIVETMAAGLSSINLQLAPCCSNSQPIVSYWGYIGIMKIKWKLLYSILGLYWGFYRDNGK